MSLINDALHRARAEAARRAADVRGEPPEPQAAPRRSSRPGPAIWAMATVILLALVGWLWQARGPRPGEQAESTVAGSAGGQQASASLPHGADPSRRAAAAREPSQRTPGREAAGAGTSNAGPSDASSAGADLPETGPAPPDRSAVVAAPLEPPSTAPQPYPEERRTEQPATSAAVESRPPVDVQDAASPAAVWPADGENGETWYYVGAFSVPGGGSIELGGIAWSAAAPSAMLNGSLLGVGDEILGLTISEIAPRTVVLEGRGQRVALQLGSTEP